MLLSVDELAERSLMVDGTPLADPAAYLPASSIIASTGSLTMQAMIAYGGDAPRFVELAPNRHLAGLAKRINRRLPVESLATVESLDALRKARQAEVRV